MIKLFLIFIHGEMFMSKPTPEVTNTPLSMFIMCDNYILGLG